MTPEQQGVKEFHKQFGLLVNERPQIPDNENISAAIYLIHEEYHELLESIGWVDDSLLFQKSNLVNIVALADSLGDLIYVIHGMALRFGIDLEPIQKEIQRSNMSKIGGYINEKGKYIKPDTYSKVDLESILIKQGWEKK